MEKIVLVSILSLFLFSSCTDKNINYYNKGYQDAWNGNKNIILYLSNEDYKKGHLAAQSQMRDYKHFQETMDQTRQEMGKAVDQASASVENLRKKVEEWGKEKQP